MCGIVAIYSYKIDAPPVDDEELLRIREAMISRGPDGKGIWVSDNRKIGMAHRRLSIIDLTDAGSQPMSSIDGRYCIVFNGEIYNYQALRAELKKKGYQFRSTSDTEVLLNLYAEKGHDMVYDLRGMYAFTIWDDVKKGLFLARDHFGIKPIYIHDDGKTFRCASQVKALLAGRGFEKRIEPAGHVGFFLWGSVPEPFTLYQDIFALPAGHTLWVDDNGPRAPQCYFDVADEFKRAAGQPAPKIPVRETLRKALRDSVRHHLIADVPVGVFLSAGIDSGTITALASHQTPNINAITLGFTEYKNTIRDEVPLAQALASRYKCKQHVSHISRQDFEDALPRILNDMDQPSIDGINTWFVARTAAQAGLKVALSGLGGDELLGGYPSFHQIPKLLPLVRIPSLLPGFGHIFRILSAPLLKRITSPKFASLFEYGSTYGGAYFLRRALFMPWELPEFLDADLVREGWETLQPVLRLDAMVAGLPIANTKISALELTNYMRNTLLRDSDWAGMAHSVEIRTPLVDVDFFLALAPYMVKPERFPSKRDMAIAPKKNLPDTVFNRPKTGFSIPVQEWVEEIGKSESARGLRGWAMWVYESSGTPAPRERRKRILALVSDAFGSNGGIAKYNRDLLTAIGVFPKVSSIIAVTRSQPNVPESGVPLKCHFDTLGTSGKWSYIREIIRILRNYKHIDLVLCGHVNLLPVAYIAARIKHAPLWCEIYGIDAWQPHQRGLVNWIAQRLNGVISISELTKNRFISWSGLLEGQCSLLPNCYDPVFYGPGPKPEKLLNRYGLRGKTVLMTFGRLSASEQYKGFDEVMNILPTLIERIPDITYLIAGDGDDKKRLQQKASALGLADRVIFTGYIPEVEKTAHYRLADVYIMPSRGEGFGFVILEAMACGIPVVASKVDGTREAIRNGRLGLLADPSKPEEIISGILKALDHPRGYVPNGLEYFSCGNFTTRCHRILDGIWAEEKGMDT